MTTLREVLKEWVWPLLALSLVVLLFVCGTACGLRLLSGGDGAAADTLVVTDTVVVRDTVRFALPVPRDSLVLRYETVRLPLAGATPGLEDEPGEPFEGEAPPPAPDSTALVRLPVSQKVYRDSTFTAWVSGYSPSLDSLHVYPRTVTITETRHLPARPARRWAVSLQAGYGITPKGLLPYAGVGVSWRVF